jgi:hypothetical protein
MLKREQMHPQKWNRPVLPRPTYSRILAGSQQLVYLLRFRRAKTAPLAQIAIVAGASETMRSGYASSSKYTWYVIPYGSET